VLDPVFRNSPLNKKFVHGESKFFRRVCSHRCASVYSRTVMAFQAPEEGMKKTRDQETDGCDLRTLIRRLADNSVQEGDFPKIREKLIELEHAQTSLNDCNDRFHMVFDGMMSGFAVCEMVFNHDGTPSDFRFLDVNPTFEETVGLRAENIVGKRLLEVLPETEAHWIETFGRVVVTGEPVRFEEFHEGLGKHFDVVAFRPREGQFAVSFTDVTKHRMAETALRQSEQRLAEVQQIAQVGGWEWDLDTGKETWSDEHFRLLGYEPGEVQPHHDMFLQRVHEDDRERITSPIVDRASGAEPFGDDFRIVWPDGSVRYVRSRAVLQRDENGTPKRVAGTATDITERKLAESVIRDSEAHLRAVLEGIQHPVTVTRISDGKVLFVNDAALKKYGLLPEEVENAKATNFYVDASDRDRLIENLTRNGKLSGIEVRLKDAGGNEFWALMSGVVTEFNGQQAMCLVTVDITERKSAEQGLKESERRHRRLLEHSPVPITVHSEGKVVLINSRAISVLRGESPEQFIGQPIVKFIHPDSRAQAMERVEKLYAGAETAPFMEQKFICLDGTEIVAEVTATAFELEGKRASQVVFNDITERKEAERLLRESEQRLAEAQRIAHVGSWEWDIKTGIEYWSDEHFRIFGLEPSEVELTHAFFLQFVHEDDRERISTPITDLLPNKEILDDDFRIVRPDGAVRHIQSRAVVQWNESGKPTRLAGTITDVTDRAVAEQSARELQDELAHIARVSVMGEMATGFAHELNQPLAAISNYSAGALRRIRSNNLAEDDFQRVLELVSDQSHRAGQIISRIRQFVAKGDNKTTQLDINETIRETAEFFGGDALKHEVAIELDLGENIPLAMGDTIQLQQVILNLARNGIEAMGEGAGESKRLTIRTSYDGANKINIAVSDLGPGFPPEVSMQVFDAFFTTKADGMGMGLSICRSIVEAHGGQLTVSSIPDNGTTFKFALPIAYKNV